MTCGEVPAAITTPERLIFDLWPARIQDAQEFPRGDPVGTLYVPGGVLQKLGATAVTQATILSDGAEGPRGPGEAASPGLTRYVPDRFHLSTWIQPVD